MGVFWDDVKISLAPSELATEQRLDLAAAVWAKFTKHASASTDFGRLHHKVRSILSPPPLNSAATCPPSLRPRPPWASLGRQTGWLWAVGWLDFTRYAPWRKRLLCKYSGLRLSDALIVTPDPLDGTRHLEPLLHSRLRGIAQPISYRVVILFILSVLTSTRFGILKSSPYPI